MFVKRCFAGGGCVELCRSLGLQDLLQLVGLLAQVLSWRETLPHFHEERCYLVATQESRRSPLQPVQNTGLHSSCVEERKEKKKDLIQGKTSLNDDS